MNFVKFHYSLTIFIIITIYGKWSNAYPFYINSFNQNCLECHTQSSGYGPILEKEANNLKQEKSIINWINPHAKIAIYQYFEKSSNGDEGKFDAKNVQLQILPKIILDDNEFTLHLSLDKVAKENATKITDYIYSPYSYIQYKNLNQNLNIGSYQNYLQSKHLFESERFSQIEYSYNSESNFYFLNFGSTFQKLNYNERNDYNIYYFHSQFNIDNNKFYLGFDRNQTEKLQDYIVHFLKRYSNLYFFDFNLIFSHFDNEIEKIQINNKITANYLDDIYISINLNYLNKDIRKSTKQISYGVDFQKKIINQFLLNLQFLHLEDEYLKLEYSDQLKLNVMYIY